MSEYSVEQSVNDDGLVLTNFYHNGELVLTQPSAYYEGAIPLKQQNAELKKQLDIAVKALGWIVGFECNQHTTRKAEEAIKQIKGE